MNHHIEVSKAQFDTLNRNANAAGIAPSMLIGQMLDDEFGGLLLNARSGASMEAIQTHVRSIELLLKQR